MVASWPRSLGRTCMAFRDRGGRRSLALTCPGDWNQLIRRDDRMLRPELVEEVFDGRDLSAVT